MADTEKILNIHQMARPLSGNLSTLPGCFVGNLPGTLVFYTNCGKTIQIDDTLKLENGVLSVSVENIFTEDIIEKIAEKVAELLDMNTQTTEKSSAALGDARLGQIRLGGDT